MSETLLNIHDLKEAKTVHDIHPLIKKRWSARAFSADPISDEHLAALFEAASWAPSSMNQQPWKYFYAHRADNSFNSFFECLMPGNKLWADKASVLVLSLAEKNFSQNPNVNRHAWHDVGAANTLLLLQAAQMEIYGHQLGGFDKEKTIETFKLPEHLEPICFIALGYYGDMNDLQEPFKSRETSIRQRNSIADFAFKF